MSIQNLLFMDAPASALGTGLGALNKVAGVASAIIGLLPQDNEGKEVGMEVLTG